tara:strand:- start:165 stop:974 length:810 start_codon:yes stop_codon:yes gene_type:complete
MVREIDRGFKKEEYYGWRAPEHMAVNYVNFCKEAVFDEHVFSNFKRNMFYNNILEHVEIDLANRYLENISRNNPQLLEKIDKYRNINDLIGNPRTYSFDKYGIDSVSPSTIRYVKVLSDLTTLYGDLNNMTIIEIGGGYGGQASILSQEYKFSKYYNIDIKYPSLLAKKYCKLNKIQNFVSIPVDKISNLDNNESYDLVISNYAFSECNYPTQDIYIDKIFSKSKRGYITHNTSQERRDRTLSYIRDYNNFQIFTKDLSVKEHPVYTWG